VLILVLVIFWSFWQSVFYTERQAEFGLEVWGLGYGEPITVVWGGAPSGIQGRSPSEADDSFIIQ